MLRQGVLLKTFTSATYCLAVALTYREKAWREFPDAASAMDAFSGWFDSPSPLPLRGIVRASLTKTGGCCNFSNWPTTEFSPLETHHLKLRRNGGVWAASRNPEQQAERVKGS
jgi:hypothetical protein